MSALDLQRSLERAAARLGPERHSRRRRRSDAGRSRLSAPVRARLDALLGGLERPPMVELMREMRRSCPPDERPPSRATVYNFLAKARSKTRLVRDLPPSVRRALYNLDDETTVPESQIAFYCFNYGDLAAMSFAAGLPWLALYQAERVPGWRSKSRGLVRAVMHVRGI